MKLALQMMKMNRKMLVPALMLVMVGCQDGKFVTPEARDAFLPEDDSRAFTRVATAHAAASARMDGTLREYHFDGDDLNSLGQARLELMLKDNSRPYPMTVYLDVEDAKVMKTRQIAVAAYLRDAGLLESQVRFEAGPNPHVTSAAAPNLARLMKTESESGVATAGPTDKPSYSGDAGGGK